MRRAAALRLLGRMLPVGWFSLIAAGVMATWWVRPGYVWLLDSVWGPQSWGGEVAEKAGLAVLFVAIGLGAYHLARKFLDAHWAWVAGTLYMLNPFVYERLLAGQWFVLGGIALLPVLLAAWWEVVASRGSRRPLAWLALLIIISPVISLHYAYIGAWLLLALTLVYVWLERPAWMRSRRMMWWLINLIFMGLVINGWRLFSHGSSVDMYRGFSSADFENFRTASDSTLGVWPNLLAGYGFWRGPAYLEPKTLLGVFTWVIAALLLLLAVLGAVRAFRRRQPLLIGLAIAAVPATVLAAGYASPLTHGLTDALMHYLPGYRGLRDTAKLTAVLMLAYALLAPYGAALITRRIDWKPATWAGLAGLVMLAVTSVTGIWNGFSGQGTVARYPAGWSEVDRRLNAAGSNTKAMVLPWRGYLNVEFAHAYTAQPAGVFFTRPVLVSQSLDNPLYEPAPSSLDALPLGLLSGQLTAQDFIREAKVHGATHILLEKTDDWFSYAQALAGVPKDYEDDSVILWPVP